MAVPLDSPNSEPLVVAPVLPAVERHAMCHLRSYYPNYTIPMAETGEVFLTDILKEVNLLKMSVIGIVRQEGKSVIKIRCPKPLRSQNKI